MNEVLISWLVNQLLLTETEHGEIIADLRKSVNESTFFSNTVRSAMGMGMVFHRVDGEQGFFTQADTTNHNRPSIVKSV